MDSPDFSIEAALENMQPILPSPRDKLLKALLAMDDPEGYDVESTHLRADDALLVYINDPEITEAYNAIEKWYV